MTKSKKFERFQRNIDKRSVEELETILIVCEGKKTEPLYFESFEVYTAQVEVVGEGRNTESLVDIAVEYKNTNEYDQVWCVFDKDDFTDQQFNSACNKARDNDIYLAYSVESFELWYILHFNYLTSQLNRKQYMEKLDKIFQNNFGKKYKKNDEDIYRNLKSLQNTAIRNAKNLEDEHEDWITDSKRFPVTYVYKLVEELNKHSRENRW